MKHPTALALTMTLVLAACTSAEVNEGPATTARPVPTAATTTSIPPTVTTEPPPSTTTTTLPSVVGTSLVDVMASVQADLDFIASVGTPGIRARMVTCDNPEATAAAFGDVFACVAAPQVEGIATAGEVGVLMMVVADDGTARWLSGTDIPSDMETVVALHSPQAGSHLCRELSEEAGYPFDVGYLGALLYWFLDGRPERMDADRDGVPCETVFSYEEVLEVWGGTAQEALLSNPRDAFQFAFVTEIAPNGSSATLDFAEFLTDADADEAAVAAGEIPEGEQVDGGFYIRNDNPLLRTFPIADEAPVDLIGFYFEGTGQGLDGIPVTALEWATLLIEAERCVAEGFPPECENLGGDTWIWYGGGFLPYWVRIEDGAIVAVEEQYLP